MREIAPHVSEMAESIAMRALALDPDERYQTADEMLDDLDHMLPYGDKLDAFSL